MPTPAAPPHQNLKGILLLTGAVAFFACLDSTAKWTNQHLPPLMTVSMRYLVSFIVTLALVRPKPGAGLFRTQRLGLQVLRSFCLFTATVTSFISLRYIPLTEMTSIAFASPLIVALLAGPLLGERIGPHRLGAVLVGFAGVLVVTRPGSHGVHPATFLVIITAISLACYSITTRMLAGHDTPTTTMLYTGLCGTLFVLPILPFVWQAPTSWEVWLAIGLLGSFGALGHWLLILAHRYTSATVLAPFFYGQLVFATVLGMLIFQERPDRWTIIGALIVMASGLYLVWRERRHQVEPSADVEV